MRWNKPLLLLGLVLVLALAASAVTAGLPESARGVKVSKTMVSSYAFLDINNIEFGILNDGTMAFSEGSGYTGFWFPRGQRNNSIIYTAGIWILGKIGGEYRCAVNCYGSEYQPGWINADGSASDPLDAKFKIYKYNAGDVVDQDAIDQGCRNYVLGDQMMFCVYNDLASHGDMWGTPSIGIEVQQTTFGFNRTGALGNTVFVEFKFINKGPASLDETYVAVFYDPDLGQSNDDAGGTDADLGIVYVYNGDNYDDYYGVQVPAMASDFFQGPIVPSPGDQVVLPDGTVYEDSKMLAMTASFFYINGSPLAGMNDPHDPQGGYYFASGYRGNGEPWTDPTTGLETKFPLSGDPVQGSGWTYPMLSSPKDIRMGNSSGPFTLAPGDEQTIVLGLVVGQGTDNLSSVTVMKYYDELAQFAYDQAFVIPSPPPQPVVTTAALDEAVAIYWDNAAVDFSEGGYEFEGYNVWQGQGPAGPWTRVATFDKANLVTTIWDKNFNLSVGALIEQPMQFGTDTGISYKFVADRDYIGGSPMVNGKPYYWAVTGYAYNPDGVPKVLENAPIGYLVTPENPVLDTQLNAEVGQAVSVTHASGPSQGNVVVTVVDPTKVTGHDYQVTFYDLEGETAWKITDVTAGVDVLADQLYQGLDDQFVVVDGIQAKVSGPAPGIRDIVQVDASGNVIDSNLHGSLNASADRAAGKCAFYTHVAGEETADWKARLNWQGAITTEDYEFRFVDDPATQGQISCNAWGAAPPYILSGYQSGPTGAVGGDPVYADVGGRLPFQSWMIELDGTATQVYTFVLEDDVNGYWDLSGVNHGWWSDQGYNFERLYGTNVAYDEAAILADGGATVVDGGFWGEWYGPGTTFSRFMICTYGDNYDSDPSGNFFTEPPAPGTIIRLRTNKPNSPADVFTFSTAGLEKSKNAEVAAARLEEINVFPNPYFAHNNAEGSFYTQFVTFNNLPEENCTIRIFSLSGQLVITIIHNNGTPFERWYLQNHEEIPVSTGMYIIHIETEFGNKILKLGVIQREYQYLHL